MHAGIVESFFLIFAGAAVLAAVALYTRQPLLVAYIAVGGIAGPHGLGWISDSSMVSEISEVRDHLPAVPRRPRPAARQAQEHGRLRHRDRTRKLGDFLRVTVVVMLAFGFSWVDAAVAGTACMFSSTIVGLEAAADHCSAPSSHWRTGGQPVTHSGPDCDSGADHPIRSRNIDDRRTRQHRGGIRCAAVACPRRVRHRPVPRPALDPQVRRVPRVHLPRGDRLVSGGRKRRESDRVVARNRRIRRRASRSRPVRSLSTSPKACGRCGISF